jgi:hypothetical protein
LGTAMYRAEMWTVRTADQKYVESFEMWCWRRMEKISWTDRVRNDAGLERVKEDRCILHTVERGSPTELVTSGAGTTY